MRTSAQEIGTALSLFYDGLPLLAIQRQLQQIYLDTVETSAIYRWVVKYTRQGIAAIRPYRANTSNTWVIDETVIQLDDGGNYWFLDCIDAGTRFLLASRISKARTIKDVEAVLSLGANNSTRTPRFIISDGLAAYPDSVERVSGSDARHIRARGPTHAININLIERFHGTLKQRTKVMRGLKSVQSASLILAGFIVHCDFFRPHIALGSRTPEEVAGISFPFRSWERLARHQS